MIMLLGDTHGNTNFILNAVIPAAVDKKVNWVYQVGDFGYWEHRVSGVQFLNDVNKELILYGINLVFIQGNHDKISLLRETYTEQDGFYKVRSNIWFAENGTVWSPNEGKTNFMALGGAYSIDKHWRLKNENAMINQLRTEQDKSYYRESLWFPEEEITDEELDVILSEVSTRVDILLTHDRPISANVPMDLRPIPECEPNQRRIQKAVMTLKPKVIVHGHLHVRYQDTIRTGGSTFTAVEGLGADVSDDLRLAWDFMDI